MLSQFFILSARGDTIVFRDYRADAPKSTPELFFKQVKTWKDTKDSLPPPAIESTDGVHFVYLLIRIAGLCKDYCGLLNEEAIRLNFVLIYELLDEVLDFGYPQGTSTEMLKSYVCNEPCEVLMEKDQSLANKKTLPSTAANKPIALSVDSMRKQKNELFIDVLERLTVLIAPNGNVLRSHLDGCILMRSFLSGTADIQLGLNEDLVIGRQEGMRNYGNVVLDDCNFHENAQLETFDKDRMLTIVAPEGEFTLMNYRISADFQNAIPFGAYTTVEEGEVPKTLRVSVHLKCEIPTKSGATNVVVRIPVPKATISASCEPLGPGQSSEYKQQEKVYLWKLKKIDGGTEKAMVLKLSLSEMGKAARKEINAISLDFEIPMYLCSGLQIKSLRVFEKGQLAVTPYRWVRYITHSDSYVFRL
ncbi:hypothetical protein EMCRGX_G026694 [Ephydatia muelleri]